MKKVITYGTYDLFHRGHYNLLKRAKELGDYLIVGVTTDNFDLERGKMNTCNNVMERIEAVKATGLADQIVIEEYRGQKIDDIQKYDVDIFAIGSDWEGYFDYLKEFCEVVYLPRTQGVSSTQLRQERPTVQLGIIGTGSIASRFVPEAENVNSANIVAAFNPNAEECKAFCDKYNISVCTNNLEELYENCNAVYIASPHYTHYEYAKSALEHGKHVLCETPFVFGPAEFLSLIKYAKCVVTGSYHALMFSLLLHTDFYIYLDNANAENSRLISSLSMFGLEKQLYYETSSLPKKLPHVDFDAVEPIMKAKREESLKLLRESIERKL